MVIPDERRFLHGRKGMIIGAHTWANVVGESSKVGNEDDCPMTTPVFEF